MLLVSLQVPEHPDHSQRAHAQDAHAGGKIFATETAPREERWGTGAASALLCMCCRAPALRCEQAADAASESRTGAILRVW